MKHLALAAHFIWQSLTAPFVANSSKKIAAAEGWLRLKLRDGENVSAALLEEIQVQGFQAGYLDLAEHRQLLNQEPWTNFSITRMLYCCQSISAGPGWAATDVKAWVALDFGDNILQVEICTPRATL